MSEAPYAQDGEVAKRIAATIPYYPFKGIPRFYDIGGFLQQPAVFQEVIDVYVARYKDMDITSIGGFDARGFILGPPLALALKKPFFMLRKPGKMPNAISSASYDVEYGKREGMCIPRGHPLSPDGPSKSSVVKPGDRVLLVDDLVATGGTLSAGIQLVRGMGATVVECACVVELKFLDARGAFDKKGHGDVPIWAMMSEDILTLDGLADASIPTEGYVDDGEAH